METFDPSSGDADFTDALLKHLEFIQSVIARLANNSFLMKGWALTVSGAFFGFAVGHSSWPIAAVGVFPAVAFWFLDTYFLQQERLYRRLYSKVASRDPDVPPFSMDISPYKPSVPWNQVMRSFTLLLFYGALTVAGLAVVAGTLLHSLLS